MGRSLCRLIAALQLASSLELSSQDLSRATLRIPPSASTALTNDGCVVLRQVAADVVQPPLQQIWRPSDEKERRGIQTECRLAAAITSALLAAPALYDPAGAWSCSCTSPYEHYAMAHLLTGLAASDMVIVILPREPMTLQLAVSLAPAGDAVAASLRCLHERTRFSEFIPCSSGSPFDCYERYTVSMDIANAIDLDKGDTVVISGDHSAFLSPPDGIAPAPMIYRFAACVAGDMRTAFRNPLHSAQLSLQVTELQGSFNAPSYVSSSQPRSSQK
jgi:hypothetical protein